MPFASKRFGFVYFPIPKVGGTSIRDVLFRLEWGQDFVPARLPSGAPTELWMHFPAIAFQKIPSGAFDGFERIVVVRDPLERLVSAYRNRVVHYREIEQADFAQLGIDSRLPKTPDFDTFCQYLPDYRRIDTIRHHTEPQGLYLGPDLCYFSKVFRLERIAELEAHLSYRTGTAVALKRLRSEGPPRSALSISDASRKAVSAYYAGDFALLKDL
jgi:hypothetical protein